MAVKKKKAGKPVKKKAVKKKSAPRKTKAKKAAPKKAKRPAPKAAAKKPAAKKAPPKNAIAIFPKPVFAPKEAATGYQKAKNEIKIGDVEDFFAKVNVIAVNLLDSLKVGDNIHIHGHTTDLALLVESMQIDHVPVQEAKAGDAVGILVNEKCRKGDQVFRVDFRR